MATFWGDILRLLAHTGLQTGENIGAQLVSDYLKPGQIAKEQLIKAYTPGLSTGSTGEQEAIAEFLGRLAGQELPRAPLTNLAGTELTTPLGRKLTAPYTTPLNEMKDLEYKPTMRLVRPPVNKLEELASGVLTRGLTGGPEDVRLGAGITSILKPEKKKIEIEYLMGLPPEEQQKALGLITAQKHPELSMFLSGPEGQKIVTAYKSAGRAITMPEILMQAANNPALAAEIGKAATVMQAQPPQVGVITPETPPISGVAPKGSIVLPPTTAKVPSAEAKEQELLKTVSANLGKITYNMPAATRGSIMEMNNTLLKEINDGRVKRGLQPLLSRDLIEIEYKRAINDPRAKNNPEILRQLKAARDSKLLAIGIQ